MDAFLWILSCHSNENYNKEMRMYSIWYKLHIQAPEPQRPEKAKKRKGRPQYIKLTWVLLHNWTFLWWLVSVALTILPPVVSELDQWPKNYMHFLYMCIWRKDNWYFIVAILCRVNLTYCVYTPCPGRCLVFLVITSYLASNFPVFWYICLLFQFSCPIFET